MGSQLVALACLPHTGEPLTPSARLVLIQMCRMAKDQSTEPIYWGGWPYLAEILGYATYDTSAKSAVKRAVRELRTKGYIHPDELASGPNRNQQYVLKFRI